MTKKLHSIDTLHISEARLIGEDGKVTFVQPALEGEYLRPGRVAYDKDIHYKKLVCSHCNVRVDFNKGAGVNSGGANLRGSRPHFKKAPKQDHELSCDLPKLGPQHSDSEIDTSIGFRIHLNADFNAPLNHGKPVYERGQGGKVVANDDRLKPAEKTIDLGQGQTKTINVYRETLVVRNVNDIVNLMRRGELKRLKDSLVVNNVALPWNRFAILGENRLRNLVHRLRNGASHPVILKVGVYQPADGNYAESAKVFFERTEKGASFIIPRIYMDGADTVDAFPARGEYLVLGLPRLSFNKQSGAYFLNISLKDAACVAPYFEGEVLAEARMRDERRNALSL